MNAPIHPSDPVGSDPNTVIEAIGSLYRENNIIASVVTSAGEFLSGTIERVTPTTITLVKAEEEDTPIVVQRCNITLFQHDLNRLGRPDLCVA